jgi:hypothetical protein
VTPVLWTSQVRKDPSPSAAGPCAAVNAASIQARAAVRIASSCSIWISAPATSAAVRSACRAAARYLSPARRIASASARLPGAGTPAGDGAGGAVLTGMVTSCRVLELEAGCLGAGALRGSGSAQALLQADAGAGARRDADRRAEGCAAARTARPWGLAGADLRLETARALGAVLMPLGRRGIRAS